MYTTEFMLRIMDGLHGLRMENLQEQKDTQNVSRQLRFVWFQREQLQTFQHQQMKKPSSKKNNKA